MIKISVDKTGELLGMFSVKEYEDYINEFVDEKAYLLLQQKVNIKDESEWLANTINEIIAGNKIIVLAYKEKPLELVGLCEIRKPAAKCFTHNVYFGLSVRKKHRGKGIGKKLLQKGIEVAKKEFKPKNIFIVVFEGNPAINLYKNLGFKEVARIPLKYNHFGELKDEIILKLE